MNVTTWLFPHLVTLITRSIVDVRPVIVVYNCECVSHISYAESVSRWLTGRHEMSHGEDREEEDHNSVSVTALYRKCTWSGYLTSGGDTVTVIRMEFLS